MLHLHRASPMQTYRSALVRCCSCDRSRQVGLTNCSRNHYSRYAIIRCPQPLFTIGQGLDVQILCDSGLQDKVASLLGIAYETRDLHIIELLALEKRHRREAIALELRKRTLLDARAKISMDYTELDDVKFILSKRGFAEEVDKYATRRDAPVGFRVPPSDFAYIYHPQATGILTLSFIPCAMLIPCTDVHSTASGSRCANSSEPRSVHNEFLSGGVVIRV
jgi:hypothetical protein